MAAFAMLGVTDVVVHCSGPEIPIMDGSAAPFVDAIEKTGVRVHPHTVEPVAPEAKVRVALGSAWATAEPLPENAAVDLILDVTIDFEDPAVGAQMPTSSRHSVLLPAAVGPITPSIWPAGRPKEICLRIGSATPGTR